MTAQRMMRPDGPTGPLDRLNRSRRLLGSQLETGTAFGGRGSHAQRGVVRTFRQVKTSNANAKTSVGEII